MGLFNFFEKNQNVTRLPESQLNEITVIKILQQGVYFNISLPEFKTVKKGVGHSISHSEGGYRQTYYTPAETERVGVSISTIVKFTAQKIILVHARENGKHIFINLSKVQTAQVFKNVAFTIELIDGRIYSFSMPKNVVKEWNKLGFDILYVYDICRKLATQYYVRQYNQEQSIKQKQIKEQEKLDAEREKKEKERIEKQERLLNEKKKEENRLAKLREKKEKEWLEKKEKAKKERIENQNRINQDNKTKNDKILNEFNIKIKKLKEAYDIDAISQEEYNELKTKFIMEIESISIPSDINPLVKIKESKELLDLGAITNEEFNKLKSKFISEI